MSNQLIIEEKIKPITESVYFAKAPRIIFKSNPVLQLEIKEASYFYKKQEFKSMYLKLYKTLQKVK